METAGQKSSAEILRRWPQLKTAIVLCGPGNNGGDGFVVARELAKVGILVTVVESSSGQGSVIRSKKRAEFTGVRIDVHGFLEDPIQADLWVDGLFGIGVSRVLDEAHQHLLTIANRRRGAKVALDTPSGLDVDTGKIWGTCFQAQLTLTMGHPKPGFFLNEGPLHCGKIVALDIGFPLGISKHEARRIFLLSPKLASRWIPRRSPTDHKAKGGRTLIWAGSSEMPGAAILAGQAALRVGAGYVYCSEREVLKFSPEMIPWTDGEDGDLTPFQSILIGPGLGVSDKTARAIEKLKKTKVPVIVDADALTVAAREKLYPFPNNWIATPHAGELSRFLKVTPQEIESDRIGSASKASQMFSCPVLLKGFHSVISYAQFSVIIPTGNVALAKGGTGDVLAGMIAGFLSQNVSPDRAPLLAAYLHGKMADDWIRSGRDYLSLTPSDLIIGASLLFAMR